MLLDCEKMHLTTMDKYSCTDYGYFLNKFKQIQQINKLFHMEKLDVECNTTLLRTAFIRKWRNYIIDSFEHNAADAILNPKTHK